VPVGIAGKAAGSGGHGEAMGGTGFEHQFDAVRDGAQGDGLGRGGRIGEGEIEAG